MGLEERVGRAGGVKKQSEITIRNEQSFLVDDEWLPSIAAYLDLAQRSTLGAGKFLACFHDRCPEPSRWLVHFGYRAIDRVTVCHEHLIPTLEVRAVERQPGLPAAILPLPGPDMIDTNEETRP